MRLTTVILIASLMQVSASGLAQKITLNKTSASLRSILKDISNQSGYSVVMTSDLFEKANPVSIKLKNAELIYALEKVFSGQPLIYTVSDQRITVSEKIQGVFDQLFERFMNISVRGRIVDKNGLPIPGANVSIKGTKQSAITSGNGTFLIDNVDEKATLVISYIGYESKELSVSKDLGDIVLSPSESKLDEVQVIAYGTTTQRLNTGNLAVVRAKEIENQVVTNPLLALAGRVPGLLVTQSTGFAGSGVTVRVQGTNSVANGSDPFYVIDGVPFISQLLPTAINVLGESGTGGLNGSPFNYINPGDIESITVLKDADATAIYGSRAANGAILINTKKGKPGETRVDLNFRNGWGRVPKKLEQLSTAQYRAMRLEGKKNDNSPIAATDYDINGFWDPNGYTNWQEELIGGTAGYLEGNVKVSGGTAATQFSLGTSYHKETTVFPGKLSDQRGAVHFSLNNSSLDQRFKLHFTGSYAYDHNTLNSTDLTFYVSAMAPNSPALRNADGSLNWAQTASGATSRTNPLAFLEETYQIKGRNLNASSVASYNILPSLQAKVNLGYSYLQMNELFKTPLTAAPPDAMSWFERSSSFGTNISQGINIEPQLGYTRKIGKGTLDALLGGTYSERRGNRQQVDAVGFSNDLAMENISAATSIYPGNSVINRYVVNSVFGRLGYNYDGAFLLNLTARRDGSSRFGSSNKFHTFAALGAAWIFSETAFIKDRWKWLSFAKLRGSYGTTGSDQIGDYRFLDLYNSLPTGVNYQGIRAMEVSQIPNPYIQWEQTQKLQFGLDLEFFENRLQSTINYYVNRSSNQLLNFQLPQYVGFGTVAANLPGEVRNTGLEFSVSATAVKSKSLRWESGFNVAVNRNKLLEFGGESMNNIVVGQSATTRKLFQYAGIDPATGIVLVLDKNGEPVLETQIGDATVYYDPTPKFFGGWSNTLSYGNFSLDVLVQFVKQEAPSLYFGRGFPNGSRNGNRPLGVLERWQQPGDVANIPRFSVNQAETFLASYSDQAVKDASYLRLRNVSLSYRLPEKFRKAVGMRDAQLLFQGQNLFTLSGYDGLDPEVLSDTRLPILRVMTLGFRAGF